MIGHILNIARSLVREHITKALTRSNHWPTVRKAHLKDQPACAACGGTSFLQVHHKLPFNEDPSKELDPTNFITLCMGSKFECHVKIGHGGSFKMYNPNVEADAKEALSHPENFDKISAKAEANRKVNAPGN